MKKRTSSIDSNVWHTPIRNNKMNFKKESEPKIKGTYRKTRPTL